MPANILDIILTFMFFDFHIRKLVNFLTVSEMIEYSFIKLPNFKAAYGWHGSGKGKALSIATGREDRENSPYALDMSPLLGHQLQDAFTLWSPFNLF